MPPDNRSAPEPFAFSLRVYYEDTDTAGVVYYANYLRYLERGRTEWLRALGIEQARLARETGLVFAVRSLAIEYLKPARLDDPLAVLTQLDAVGRAQVTLKQWIERGGETLVEASVRIACLDVKKMKPAALPAEIGKRMSLNPH
ncbi:MAG: tol-pal system-associated acyl-CoA thioesterase [Zoogloeaceae bacterium]|jgi:acyl-CoA thioester hydrolase|nr:tol-pal system-associated acyl-CoA thioesterase [Zoogloeaceae bacterium]